MVRRSRRHGVGLIYGIFLLTALIALASLAVDWGRVQAARTELQRTADAAARAGAAKAPNGLAAVRAEARFWAARNLVDGSPLVLLDEDVQLSNWKSPTPNAVTVTARRTAARGTAVPLVLAAILGKSTCDVSASATAVCHVEPGIGFVGLEGIEAKNNFFVGSYHSAQTSHPIQTSAGSHTALASNGPIVGNNNGLVSGSLILGPGTPPPSGMVVQGGTTYRPTPVEAPADPAWTPHANPGGLSASPTIDHKTTLPGGTYWFTSLTIDANVSFSGPATIYVNGDMTIGGDLTAHNNIPSNLHVYQLGTNRSFGDTDANGMSIVGIVSAPGGDLLAKNKLTLCGGAVFKSMTFKNTAELYADEALGPAGGGTRISLVR